MVALVISLQVLALLISVAGVWYELRKTFGVIPERGETLNERRKRLGLEPLPTSSADRVRLDVPRG